MGTKIAKEIGAVGYFECGLNTQKGLDDVLNEVSHSLYLRGVLANDRPWLCTRTAATEEKGVEEAESLIQKGGEKFDVDRGGITDISIKS